MHRRCLTYWITRQESNTNSITIFKPYLNHLRKWNTTIWFEIHLIMIHLVLLGIDENGDLSRRENISTLYHPYFQNQCKWAYAWLHILGLNVRLRRYSEKIIFWNICSTTIGYLVLHLKCPFAVIFNFKHSLYLKFKETRCWPFSLLLQCNGLLKFFLCCI